MDVSFQNTDYLVDCVRMVLKAQYRQRLQELRERLGSFDAINWEGVKAQARRQAALQALPENVQNLAALDEIRFQAMVAWIEQILAS